MINKYKLKSGQTRYGYNEYIGTDPITGEEIRARKQGFKTVKEARDSLARHRIELESNGISDHKNATFQEVYNLWLKEHTTQIKEASLRLIIATAKKHVLPKFGKAKIKSITILMCQKIVNDWASENYAIKHKKTLSQQVFDYAIKLGIISINPMKLAKSPRRYKEKNKNFYSKKELNILLDCLEKDFNNPNYLPFFRLLAYTGIRKSEALALTWGDIDFENKILKISKNISYDLNGKPVVSTTKTVNSIRDITLDSNTIAILSDWRKEQELILDRMGCESKENEQLLFHTENNCILNPTSVNYWLDSTLKKNNLRHITVHGFRHTHCSLLFEIDTPVHVVKERLGHSDINTTLNIYTHVTDKKRDDYADKFAEYMSE